MKIIAVIVALLLGGFPLQALADAVTLTAQSTLQATDTTLQGEVAITFHSGRPVYHPTVVGLPQAGEYLLGSWTHWDPEGEYRISFTIPAQPLTPGQYHLLLDASFQDPAGVWLGVSLAVPYEVGTPSRDPLPHPEVTLQGNRLAWHLPPGVDPDRVRLTLPSAPFGWSGPRSLSPADPRFQLVALLDRRHPVRGRIDHLARLDWEAEGFHRSTSFPWAILTDDQGAWFEGAHPPVPIWEWRNPWLWGSAATLLWLLAAITDLRGRGRRIKALARQETAMGPPPPAGPLIRWPEGLAWTGTGVLTVWLFSHLSPRLWWLPSWPTGGDLASHTLYAQFFADWVQEGRISGWMPEVFTGFPAFNHYFPLPFFLVAWLGNWTGVPIALKWVATLPALLLPLATHGMGRMLGWSSAACLLAAGGAMGFLVNDGNSIWGGNLYSQFAGEFANSWGYLFMVLYLGAQGRLLAPPPVGGRVVWLVASVALAWAAALSHGYAWLMTLAGGGILALANPWQGGRWATLAMTVAIHLTAAALAGFWLVPFLLTGGWTIPNDTAITQLDWRVFWPEALRPFAIGWLFFVGWRRLSAPLSVAAVGVGGFLLAPLIGLADIRFAPYAQWGITVAGGAILGEWLTRRSPAALGWAAGLLAWLPILWESGLDRAATWSRWNLGGYEQKALASEWREMTKALGPGGFATTTAAGVAALPRIAVEHHPYNDDLGSTRAVEAMPLFGTRPVLEGLYMEASITSPFVYQIQAEISTRPSSPLSRYPALGGSVDQAVAHLNEFYADTLVLRSPEMQRRYREDPRFQTVGEFGPFLVVRLNHLASRLIDRLPIPVRTGERSGWLDHSFQRFVVDYPYRERLVFPGPGETVPPTPEGDLCATGEIRLLALERERVVFATDRPGCPHLLRMTYHPFWQATTGETLLLAEPSFMVVYPAGNRVEMVFDAGLGRRPGLLASGAGVLGLLGMGWWVRRRHLVRGAVSEPGGIWSERFPWAGVGVGLFLAGVVFLRSPEQQYRQGHQALNLGHHGAAAAAFDAAWSGRAGWARQAESLFWAARTMELAGRSAEAAPRYRLLWGRFPASFWAPESVFRLALLDNQAGRHQSARNYRQVLRDRYPGNRWTEEMGRQMPE